MRWPPCLMIVLAGCGRVAFDPLGGGVDPTGDGGHLDGPGGGGGGGDGAGGGDAPLDALASPGCGSSVILVDDFEDGQVGGGPWTIIGSAATTQSESGGSVHVTVNSGANMSTSSALRQTASQALDGTCVIAELTQVPAGGAAAYVRIGLPTKYIQIEVTGGIVQGRSDVGGSGGTAGGGSYDAVADRFLRIRATGSRNYALEVGPSLGELHAFGALGGSFSDPSPAPIEIGVVTTAGISQPQSAAFASVYLFAP